MFAAAVHEGATRTDQESDALKLGVWLERAPEQLWLDLQSPTMEELAGLRDRFNLHPLAVEECDHTGVRPKIEEFQHHLYIVLHGINHNEGEHRLDTVEFKIFVWPGHLITVHDKASSSIRLTQERLHRDRDLMSRHGVDRVLHQIVDTVIDHYFPLIEEWEDRIERIEVEVFRNPQDSLLEEMLQLQRNLLTAHRLIQPQLDILAALSSGRYKVIDQADLAYFRDVYDHLHRINDRLHIVRELLATAMQCYLSQISNRMNAVMKSLAVLGALTMPASFVASLLGMNLEHLPGRGDPDTFWWIALLCVSLGMGALAVLKRLRWL
jgi:magnesium transporter